MISILAILPYVPKRKDNCCCENQEPLDIPIEYYLLSVALMIIVAIFVYRYLRKEGGLDEGDLVGFCIFSSPFILIPGLNSFILMLITILIIVGAILILIMNIINIIKKLIKKIKKWKTKSKQKL